MIPMIICCNLFADETNFSLFDEKIEKTFKFSLKESLSRAKMKPLFKVIYELLYILSEI